jgi:hypothetical protein
LGDHLPPESVITFDRNTHASYPCRVRSKASGTNLP